MSELNPIDVLADLFFSDDFEITLDCDYLAEMTLQRLRDAGFAVVDAKRFAALEAALEAVRKGTN